MAKLSVITKDGLPQEAFALVPHPEEPDTWLFPHYRKSVLRAGKGKLNIEDTVDWKQVEAALRTLSPASRQRLAEVATPEGILTAAGHLAAHYRKAGKSLPDILAVLA